MLLRGFVTGVAGRDSGQSHTPLTYHPPIILMLHLLHLLQGNER
jgi:hypothetical protein